MLLYLYSCYIFYFYFFFFQAEDGIRDGRVTGVQTCALPISMKQLNPNGGKVMVMSVDPGISTTDARVKGFEDAVKADSKRSEERRVGKSVDLGGRRIIKKKKRNKKKKKIDEYRKEQDNNTET